MRVNPRTSFLLTVVSWIFLVMGCAGDQASAPQLTLNAPIGTNLTAKDAMNQGNQRFAEGRWGAAKVLYEQASKAQPDLAEAHYNLALALERLGEPEQARQHYIEAANLAPGHQVIWDSPPLRRFGNVKAKKADGPLPTLPSLGGAGGGLGEGEVVINHHGWFNVSG